MKLTYEIARLLYVATTRAKRSLHLTAVCELDHHGQPNLKAGSFAALLKNQFQQRTSDTQTERCESSALTQHTSLNRIPTGWCTNYQPPKPLTPAPENPLPEEDNFLQRTIGTIIHELLATLPPDPLTKAKQLLEQSGVNHPSQLVTLDQLQLVRHHLEHDPKAQWIFSPHHQQAANELEITTIINRQVKHFIVDRTFIDNGVRWIIDYKTATPQQQSTQQFLSHQAELYREQLNCYAKAFHGLDNHPIKLGLYFPICALWIELTPTPLYQPLNLSHA